MVYETLPAEIAFGDSIAVEIVITHSKDMGASG
jgi:hypothetical protein